MGWTTAASEPALSGMTPAGSGGAHAQNAASMRQGTVHANWAGCVRRGAARYHAQTLASLRDRAWGTSFVGYCVENESGRVSSAITSFDAKSRAGITRSGRRYVLSGDPGFDADAMHVWSFWSQRFSVTEVNDISGEYCEQAEKGHPASGWT